MNVSSNNATPVNTLTLTVAFGAVVLLAALVVFASLPNSTKFMHVLHKTGHPLAFGLMSLCVLWLLNRLRQRATSARATWSPYLVAFVITVLIGALTEIAQMFTHRDARVVDVMSDAVGALACLAFHAAIFFGRSTENPPSKKQRAGLMTVAMMAVIIAMSPLVWCLAAYTARDSSFPIILQYPTALDMFFVSTREGTISVATMNDGLPAIKVDIDHGEYPGLRVSEPYPRWSAYKSLSVNVTNPGLSELTVVIRVSDRAHNEQYEDRFNRRFALPANSQTTLTVPLSDIQHAPKGRLLNLEKVAALNIFAVKAVLNGEFYVTKIWLH